MARKKKQKGWRLTIQGNLFLLVLAVVLGSAYLLNHSLLFLIEGFFAAIFIYDALFLRLVFPKLHFDWQTLPQLFAQNKASFPLIISHPRRWFPIRHLRIHLRGTAISSQPVLLDDLNAGEQATVTLHVVASKRGHISLNEVELRCGYPFGFWEHYQIQKLDIPLLVFPQLLAQVPMSLTGNQHRSGVLPKNTDDFQYLDQYRSGDDVRLIHWRKSTLSSQPVIRKDLSHLDAAKPKVLIPNPCPNFEWALSVLTTMAYRATHWEQWTVLTPKGRQTVPDKASFLRSMATLSPLSQDEVDGAQTYPEDDVIRMSDISALMTHWSPEPIAESPKEKDKQTA